MNPIADFGHLSAALRRRPAIRPLGRVRSIHQNRIEVVGLSNDLALGCRVSFPSQAEVLIGECISMTSGFATIVVEGSATSLAIDDPVLMSGPPMLTPDESWLGRVIDPDGQPLDGRPLLEGKDSVALDASPPSATRRRDLGDRLATGLAVFDTILPIVRGQRIGLFAGSGVGKSSLMGILASDLEADVVVVGLVGERGREVGAFVRRVLGPAAQARSVVIAATSDRSALTRRRAALTAVTVAEFFRDQGHHVLLLVDSVTRLAEAHREIASAAGEAATMRGYPPSLVPFLASFTERTGPGLPGQGDITAVMTVLVAGSDMDEPVADTLRGMLDGHVVLSRDIAERGRFPAVDLLQSVSRALPEAATKEENETITEARRLLGLWQQSEILVRSGLYQSGTNPELDRAVAVFEPMERFLATRTTAPISESFAKLRTCLNASSELEDSGDGRKVAS